MNARYWVLLLVGLVVFALLDLLVMAADPTGHFFLYPLVVLAVAVPLGYLGRRLGVRDPHDDSALFEFDLDHGETSKQPDDEAVDRPESGD